MSKILVIDDEPWLRELVRTALELHGFEIIEAGDGNTGVQLAIQHRPDLVLCDVNMVGRADAGFDALARLREDSLTAAIPFILMTGMADAAGMRHGMSLGADDYLAKPFKVEELYATVNARLRKVQSVRAEAEKKLTQLQSQISLMMPHEMRTPLNGIISNAELLAESADSFDAATVAEMSREICQSAQRLERLIENFLILAQLELVAADPQKTAALRSARNAHAAEIVRDESISQAGHVGRAADLLLDLAESPVAMAEDYFRKVTAELVSNAFKFSANGRRVQVRLSSAGGRIELSVSDAGCGFTPVQISRVGAYVQFDRQMEDRQGLGLGLAIAKKLVELHGGTLDIASETGAGAVITVRLPVPA